MKIKKIIVFAILFTVHSSYAVLYFPPKEWTVDGPGGKYGVFSYHTEYSFITAGPVVIEVPFGFKGAKKMFVFSLFAIPSICVAGIYTIKRRLAKRKVQGEGRVNVGTGDALRASGHLESRGKTWPEVDKNGRLVSSFA